MFPQMTAIIEQLLELVEDKTTGSVRCCWCNNHINFIKYGKYRRYKFTTAELIEIQRYLCKNDQCNRTFSILPHPFLRITRFSLCMFSVILDMFEKGLQIAEISKHCGMDRQVIARAVKTGKAVFQWLVQEAKTDPAWGPSPCLHPHRCWSDFIRMFAAKFYPKRYGKVSPTEPIYCN